MPPLRISRPGPNSVSSSSTPRWGSPGATAPARRNRASRAGAWRSSLNRPNNWRHVTLRGSADKPRWSADGTRLFFVERTGGFYNAWVVGFDQSIGRVVGAPRQLTRYERPDFMVSDFGAAELSVGRNFIILPMTERTGSIWMLDAADR